MRGGTCRCPMCGRKQAETKAGRGLYVRYNVRCDEYLTKWDKKYGRRMLRTKMKQELLTLS